MALEWIGLFLLVLIIVWRFLPGAPRGRRGEVKVSRGLTRRLDPNDYRVIENVTLPVANGTTQIDHLIISPFGIFVVETKTLTGWIFGSPSRAEWTQVIYGHKQRFRNPLHQNQKHVSAVRDLLNVRSDRIHNVVVFMGDSTVKTQMPASVVNGLTELVDFILSKTAPVFSEDDVQRFVTDIEAARLKPGSRTDRLHVENVERSRSSAAYLDIDCPYCGGAMTERVNRGSGVRFLGCVRYPQCRGARSLPETVE